MMKIERLPDVLRLLVIDRTPGLKSEIGLIAASLENALQNGELVYLKEATDRATDAYRVLTTTF